MKIISGNSNIELSKEIAKYANTPLSTANMTRFSDKEIFVEIDENVRGEESFHSFAQNITVIVANSTPSDVHFETWVGAG